MLPHLRVDHVDRLLIPQDSAQLGLIYSSTPPKRLLSIPTDMWSHRDIGQLEERIRCFSGLSHKYVQSRTGQMPFLQSF
jgi:hypothetical protein